MVRPTILLLLFVVAACTSKQRVPDALPKVLPVQVQREWRLHDAVTQPLDAVPEPYRRFAPLAWALAHYQANGMITVRLFQLQPGTAFEANQKWHDASALGFFRDDYFGTAESEKLSREELAGFVQDLRDNIKTK